MEGAWGAWGAWGATPLPPSPGFFNPASIKTNAIPMGNSPRDVGT